jgi:hypothetical protein
VYAGAAREAVFSVPAVARRVRDDFVPLALRATLVNRADAVRDPDERWLYQRVNRAKIAPQGIAILDSRGQVLVWAQMFDDDRSVLDFLDHGLKRFREQADAGRPAVTERYMRFPGMKAGDFQDTEKVPAVPDGHPQGKRCPAASAKGAVPPGSLVARLVGRALDAKGEPLADTVKQEHYAEDQFVIAPALQEAVAKALAAAGPGRVRLPDDFARACAGHAALGHIDVQPFLFMNEAHRNKGEWKRCEFWAEPAAAAGREPSGNAVALWRIVGESEIASEVTVNGKGVHDVKLAWEGFVAVQAGRMTRLLLAARGNEKLQFANDDHSVKKVQRDEVAFLPAGRLIDLACGVRYGIIAAPVAEGEAGGDEPPGQVPEEVRRQIVEAMGGPFVVFRSKVPEDLKLSPEQNEKLEGQLLERVQDAMQFFRKLEGKKPEEAEKELEKYRPKAREKLAAFLKEALKEDQLKRLRQLELQQEGAFALGLPDVGKELNITDDQRRQFMAVVQELHKKVEPLIREARSGGRPEEIHPKVMKIRKEQEGKIEALLTDAQRKQWKEMLGKPFDLGE